ncbi:NAD(P)H-quinone oxidoreductase [Halotalea alkalilenta]|uniref:NAD(P)H-quinone oxidoreductase n=1 Tax=Halotalea alkalilenta TaxID=376489 RepID=UPI0005BE912C|nr:NAD(P)H-quinone oxidoreductase [Halotalea alkalilenta]
MNQSLPSHMSVIEFDGAGGPEVIAIREHALPTPGPGEILVKVAAAGVNRPDVMQRQGKYPPPPGASHIPGLEIAGRVVGLGAGATRFEEGERVCGLVAGGGYAEYCVIHEDNALHVPIGLGMVEAAALPETFMTVWTNLFQDGRLKAGDRVLIHGGSSGIGTTAIMLARAFAAEQVIVTVGSQAKAEACLKLGASAAINYREQDFVEEVSRLTDGYGVDLILDMIGGDYVTRNYRAAAKFGRIIQIATQRGHGRDVELFELMKKRLTHTGSTLRARSVAEKAEVARELEREVWPLIERGEIKPLIDATFPLARAADAHALMDAGHHIGKIVLVVGEG